MRQSAQSANPHTALERAFAGASLIAAVSAGLAGALVRAGYGLEAVGGVVFSALLLCALAGIWAQDRITQHQRGEVARVYATALKGKRDRAVERRAGEPSRLEAAGLAMAGLIDDMRAALLGRDTLARWVGEARLVLTAKLRDSEALASQMHEDARLLVEAAANSRRAEADLVCRLGQARGRAELAVKSSGGVTEAVSELTEAVRDLTNQSRRAADISEQLADVAFNTQMRVAGLSESTSALTRAADQVQVVLHRSEMLGINASIEAARAGADAGGFAVVAAEVKTMAQAGHAALEAMMTTLRALQGDVAEIAQRVQHMGAAVAAQHEFGDSLAHAALLQGNAVERLLREAGNAHGDLCTLQDALNGFRLPENRLGAGAATEQMVERLPAYADAITKLIRELPDFRPADTARTDR